MTKTIEEKILTAIREGENIDDVLSKYNDEIIESYKPKQLNLKLELRFANSSNNPDPEYVKESDSGFDLRAFIDKPIILEPFDRILVPTGLYFEIPEGYEIQVRPRSGLAIKHGITVLNTPGTVDCFSENMLITTIDGDKKINELSINDIIISFNEETLEFEKDILSEIHDTGEKEILEITTEDGVLEVTETTYILTDNGWKYAKDLTDNDRILINI